MPPSPSVSGQARNGCIKRMMGDITLNSPETPEIEKKPFNENYHPLPPIRRNISSSSRTPNYLKASTGSCHDFCKFGKAYSNENKPRIPFQRRAASKFADDQVFARRNNATVPQVKKRAITLRSKSFPAPQSSNLDHISNVRKEKPSQLDRRKLLVNGLRFPNDTLVSKPSSSNLRKPQSPLVIETFKRVLSQRKERRLSGNPIYLPVKSIYVTTRCVSSSVKNKEDVNENKSLSSSSTSRRRNIEPKKPLAATLSLKPFMGKRRTIKSVDPRFSVGKRFIHRKEAAANKEKKVMEDAAAVDKACKDNEEEICQSLPITEFVDDQDQILNNEYMIEIPVTAVSYPNSSALSFQEEEESCRSLPITELVDDPYQIDNNDEITVTAMSVPNSPALSFQDEDQMEINDGTCPKISHCQMISSSLVSTEEEKLVMDNGNRRKVSSSSEIPEEEDETDVDSSLSGTAEYSVSDFDENEVANQEAKSSGGICVEEDAKPVKLQFRRGKLLELQSESDNTPMRLRFRSVTRIGEKQDGNAVALNKIIMDRAAGLDGGEDDEGWLKNGCDAKVVLKRSDHQPKTEAQASLLNNVIKETASKLVESRKSKVKALVGAFETVMYFNDTKPSTANPIIQ